MFAQMEMFITCRALHATVQRAISYKGGIIKYLIQFIRQLSVPSYIGERVNVYNEYSETPAAVYRCICSCLNESVLLFDAHPILYTVHPPCYSHLVHCQLLCFYIISHHQAKS